MTEFVGKGAPLTGAGFDKVNHALSGNACSLWALISVETSGFGFRPDRRPKILFEQHWFHRFTNGIYDKSSPDISSPTRGYPKGVDPYDRLAKAQKLDRMAALKSTSWGLGQIMGCNATTLGYRDAADMVEQFLEGEDAQLEGVLRFITTTEGLAKAFKAQDWKAVARSYNGDEYAKNEYDSKLALFFDKYTREGTPDVEVRTAQARLAYLGFDPHGVDGLVGNWTTRAIAAFQNDRGIPVTATLDNKTLEALAKAVPFD
jgi:hypothetical protein